MKKILIAIDFSQITKQVVEVAKYHAKLSDSEVCIIHTEEPPVAPMGVGPNYILFPVNVDTEDVYVGSMSEVKNQEKERSRTRLNEIKIYLEESGVKATAIQLTGETADKVLEEADRFMADLIVIGAHDHGALYHLFFGSVRESLINKAKCPVLVVPPQMGE
ncbi:MAG: universal stress protein [Bacteriovoracaceae bacterium]|nr:universal stress protein [Bacteriovoracaceae bacterium]